MTSNLPDTLPSNYQTFIGLSRYARWIEALSQRENFGQTVDRYTENVVEKAFYEAEIAETEADYYADLLNAHIRNLEIMPSMRAMMTAGPALNRDNTAGYNCAFMPVDSLHSFREAMLILSNGTGVGFSVEKQFVSQLPEVSEKHVEVETTITIEDNKEAWSYGLHQLISLLYAGIVPKWDTSLVRPAGTPLKTFGGRASGPEPLEELFHYVVKVITAAAGRQLTAQECHDIMCKIAQVIVVGGVRRSAMISLSDLDDSGLRVAKAGQWWETNPERALANNSVAYDSKPCEATFWEEWKALEASGSGERGIFNREAARNVAKQNNRRKTSWDPHGTGCFALIPFGTNPCSEIILRPYQFCNLTEVVVRAGDTVSDLERKVELAAILGTVQSTFTYFPHLRSIWKKNTEEERLLGVSLTGIMDNTLMTHKNAGLAEMLEHLKVVAVETNKRWAGILGIPQSAAVTCVKPSGTVSQLVDSASGIHNRFAPYYLRTVRNDNKDPITKLMKDQGVYWEPNVMEFANKGGIAIADLTNETVNGLYGQFDWAFDTQTRTLYRLYEDHAESVDTEESLQFYNTTVFYFPMKAPEDAVFRDDMSAIEQLELWLTYQKHWCEHKPSITVFVKPEEWIEVGKFVYGHFDFMSGVSFLPFDGGTYQQAPYTEITKEEYEDWFKNRNSDVDWSLLKEYELEDMTKGSQELACVAGGCEI